MTIKFVLLVNKQGQTRLAKYTDQSLSVEERRALEGEIVRKCLARSEKQVWIFRLLCMLLNKSLVMRIQRHGSMPPASRQAYLPHAVLVHRA